MNKTSSAYEAFFEDCFVEKDPICNLRREDSLVLDHFASELILEMLSEKSSPNI